ncbi:MAG: 50S ribosomal protein L4 [Acidithiobacillus sp.]|nr:50S ribosomal protein L4 [Acidithiobacillus sp.]
MQVNSKEISSGKQMNVDLPESVFDVPYNESLLHQVVVAQLAGLRSGTAVQKNRAAVRGGGRKPWKQKGGGRARAGSIRSPIWRGGGRAFPGVLQSYKQKVNKKMWAGAMRTALAELLRQDRLQFVIAEDFPEPKTKLGRAWLENAGGDDVLVILAEAPMNFFLALRNLPRVAVAEWQDIGPADLIRYGRVLMDVAAAQKLAEIYG